MNQTFVIIDYMAIQNIASPRVHRNNKNKVGRPVGVANKIPWHRDRGCLYSEGLKCIECPFRRCYKELARQERDSFRQEFITNGSKHWKV